jgi:ubiquinone/menaquinone biosynthesis C-methylase UbiE
MPELSGLYRHRFEGEAADRRAMWRVLCRHYFQKWVDPGDVVVDVAAGSCDFINEITAVRRVAVDLNPDVRAAAEPGVEALVGPADELPLPAGTVDVVFVSNFFEHLERTAILDVLAEIRRILKPSGRILILQPNIRFCGRDYWRFFDHITPIDDRALEEALVLRELRVVHRVTRFLPFTAKSKLPTSAALVRAYLRLPFLWRLFGQQTFLVAVPA